MTNSQRFFDAYNKTDNALHSRFGIKQTVSYTDAVRRVAAINSLVRKFEDDLVDYGRLRNAIVHNSDANKAIAEPHDDVTERFERIAEILCSPPKASSIAHEPSCVKPTARLLDAIAVMNKKGFSIMPVIEGGAITGVLTNKSVVEFVANNVGNIDNALETATVADAAKDGDAYYSISKDCTVDDVLKIFEDKRKMRMLILTDNGKPNGKILGIITIGDLVSVTKMLDF